MARKNIFIAGIVPKDEKTFWRGQSYGKRVAIFIEQEFYCKPHIFGIFFERKFVNDRALVG